jgi:DNA invertase Pin-like site-specific DNA recombinase
LRRTHADEIVSALVRFDLGPADEARPAGEPGPAMAESSATIASEPVADHRVPQQRSRKAGGRKRGNRPYRVAPNNLVDLYRQFAGSPAAIAKAQGVPRQTVNNWLRTARNNGRLPLLEPRLDGA